MSKSVVTQWDGDAEDYLPVDDNEGECDVEDDLPMEDIYRIMREVACGSKRYRPDTPAEAKFRAEVEREAKQMEAKGQQLHISSDWV